MAKRRIGIIVIVLCLCICCCMVPCSAQVTSSANASKPIATEKECALTISYCCDSFALTNSAIKLYKIATASADCRYTLTAPYQASGLVLNGVQSTTEWNIIRSTLETYILANALQPDMTATTDENGQVNFSGLKTGLYLAVSESANQEDLHYYFDSALVLLPGLGTDNHWQYQVTVNAKGTLLPPITPDEDMQYKVVKLWKGDESNSNRPESIEVEIFRNGESCNTIFLSEENNWSYTWSTPKDGAVWKVVERNVPDGYTMTVEERDGAFVLTNTATTPPDTPPAQTGDTSNVLLYIILMIISGSALVIIGIFGKRNNL